MKITRVAQFDSASANEAIQREISRVKILGGDVKVEGNKVTIITNGLIPINIANAFVARMKRIIESLEIKVI